MAERIPKTSKELQNAIYDDFKRKVQDEAKKRAVSQHVDYDTFKNMVSVAHLRPLHAPCVQATAVDAMAPAWQFAADGTRQRNDETTSVNVELSSALPTAAPATSGDFQREWRRSCKTEEDKYKYLRLCGPATLRAIFKVEVGADLLGDMLQVIDAAWLTFASFAEDTSEGSALAEAAFVVSVLMALSDAGRFALTIRLLGAKAKESMRQLFHNISSAVAAAEAQDGSDALLSSENVEKLKGTYGAM
uniref:Dynein attachment factor N-terminal domain-containing protein n=1 Tax=Tetraselmis chuii TaxID=63592 RepID=A0A7S1X9I0_9CHLO|mmetsp:Transcript_4163/g.7610  ORF Transcript_4163/g.7610 Transcript_4163/m.7610 type:complete len:247 (+) Transcript_4163:188-928(+)|eukprot:CAMPEP_0177763710 /NCGR_PEP_ID=MMETSP0491_2-20121128/7012_1 /TAXON_ID=63592 /ORGANISM="Tetraselmis chuii, Strain PLY429" /LENGTH=246 /DNA_ID=CAMNT_0019279827 /DNA_START=150 /DNA_END=890 /DNA_ORIENTATION=-